jgi:hypothetical protein
VEDLAVELLLAPVDLFLGHALADHQLDQHPAHCEDVHLHAGVGVFHAALLVLRREIAV